MGLIFDTSILIGAERLRETVRQIVQRVQLAIGDADAALSTVSIVELTHGIYRAKTQAQSEHRQAFCDEVCRDMKIIPVSLEIARLAGQIQGEQAANGIAIAFEDLVIGATALHLGFDVATLNVKHFEHIPGLTIVQL